MPEPDGKIPIVVGVTGHRLLPEDDLPALRDAVQKELAALRASCPNSPFELLTNLAEGADMLAAAIALDLGFSLKAALPMEQTEYEKEFSDAALADFRSLLSRSDAVFTAPPTEAPAEGRTYLYRQADIYVAEHCHVLLSLWDGTPAVQGGCGAAETVSFCLSHDYVPARPGVLFSDDGAVIHVFAPRTESETPAGTTRFLGNEPLFREILADTERFNAAQCSAEPPASGLTPDREDPVRARLEASYAKADALSIRNAKTYRRTLRWMAAAATLLTFSFLLYDEAALYVLVLVPGLMILALFLMSRIAGRLHCHRNYLEYRVLAEVLRVQTYLRYSGSGESLADHLPWPMKQSTPWVQKALAALNVGALPEEGRPVLDLWIRAQKDYHEAARFSAGEQERGSALVTKVALVVTVIAYFAALLFELIPGGLLTGRPLFSPALLEFYRTFLKILLGSLSAMTLFIGSYYGKLSLPNAITDHERMAALYRGAEEAFANGAENEAVLLSLAREELNENANWFSYKSVNQIDVSL